MPLRLVAPFIAAVALVAVSCGSTGEGDSASPASPSTVSETTSTAGSGPVAVVDGAALPEGGVDVYDVWVDTGSGPVRLGELDAGGTLEIPADDVPDGATVLLSIEADAAAPTGESVVLAGEVAGGEATLTVDHPSALGVGLEEASGEYILATPTDGEDNNELSGVWWTAVPRAQSLFLPELPDAWVYEGWLIVDGTALTMGTFRDPFAADDAAPYSGPIEAPPLVGEDLIVNAPEGLVFPLDLRGQEVTVTIEPADDADPGPSGFVFLAGAVPLDAVDHTTYPVVNLATELPVVTVAVG